MAAVRPASLHPVFEAVRRAPIGAPFTPEQRAELDQAMEDIAAGRVKLVPHDDVPAWLEAQSPEALRE